MKRLTIHHHEWYYFRRRMNVIRLVELFWLGLFALCTWVLFELYTWFMRGQTFFANDIGIGLGIGQIFGDAWCSQRNMEKTCPFSNAGANICAFSQSLFFLQTEQSSLEGDLKLNQKWLSRSILGQIEAPASCHQFEQRIKTRAEMRFLKPLQVEVAKVTKLKLIVTHCT